ncbi:putative membrane protein [Frankia alni ACN14a]|uniref:Membrane protein n=1 Tax=Frankia alni (strain DSM 45986 / CECT 9034 / ACN14a) TaxID=326424 RepID=Q0RUP5_FRAAA|nr:putative membrane protein [Frankia alni ACN14a]
MPVPDAVRPAAPAAGRGANATAAYERPIAAPSSAGTTTAAAPPHAMTTTSPGALDDQLEAVPADRASAPRGPGRPGPGTGSARPPGAGRRAKLRLSKVNPLTVTRLSFAFSLCVFVVLLVAVAVLWFVLNSIGVFNSVTDAADTLTDSSASNVRSWLSFGRAMEISLLIGAINVILMTALTTLGALLYNLCAEMIGGIELTLSDQ